MNRGIAIVLILICVAVFGVSAYKLVTYYGANRAAEKDFSQLLPEEVGDPDAVDEFGKGLSYEYLLPYYKKLREENGDMVGWLRIPKTRISYPVMQTPDSPEYYLDKDFQKKYSMNGSLFVSSICDVDTPSDVVTIYGHRMKTGSMFGRLGDYLDEGFIEEHDTIIFDTFTERNVYKVYSVFSLAVNTHSPNEFDYYNFDNFYTKDRFDWFMTNVRERAEASNPSYAPMYGDKILLLSTCEYTHADGRLLLIAVRTK